MVQTRRATRTDRLHRRPWHPLLPVRRNHFRKPEAAKTIKRQEDPLTHASKALSSVSAKAGSRSGLNRESTRDGAESERDRCIAWNAEADIRGPTVEEGSRVEAKKIGSA